MAFNLKKIKVVDTFEYEIKDYEGKPLGVFFTLASPSHPKTIEHERSETKALIDAYQKTGSHQQTQEESEKSITRTLVARTLDWRGYTDDEGNDIPFSQDEAKSIYENKEYMWIADQVKSALETRANFTKNTSKA